MPAGRRGHKIREFKRRVDAVLEEERSRRGPLPPAINEEHRELRRQIDRAYRALLGSEASENADPCTRVLENPELAIDAVQILDLLAEERDLLIRNGVDGHIY
jgi:hypothetical protein